LILFGILHVVMGLGAPKVQWWWTRLLLGISDLVLGVWAVRSHGGSLLTSQTLVGVRTIFVGVREIFVAFTPARCEAWRRTVRIVTRPRQSPD
jgi:uncharacterized membrane protein HdeD (DUF308 family)